MIHGGLELSLVNFSDPPADDISDEWPTIFGQFCCLANRSEHFLAKPNWFNGPIFSIAREENLKNQWLSECKTICKSMEDSGFTSFRQGMNEGLKIYGKTNLAGPARIDLTADISCNLACRTCGPGRSTFWQKHLKEHNLTERPYTPQRRPEESIDILRTLDLSNLRMFVFCGGETLLGKTSWEIVKWLVDNVPNAKEQLTVCFQTNGTMPIDPAHFELIEKVFLVKLHVSLDGIEQQFEYLRWPASWAQVTDNILNMRETLPSNVMFLVEETLSLYNLATTDRLAKWVADNFSSSRFGDIINHSRHLATGISGLHALSTEYAHALAQNPSLRNLIPTNFTENTDAIKKFLAQTQKFDQVRNQDFRITFPEVAEYYQKFW
jgi:sulfatase maturation enzyme AslB (radical SAM superfamily)